MRSLIKESMMRRQYWDGNLSLATSRPGVLVRCVQVQEELFKEFWARFAPLQALELPTLKGKYVVRYNVVGEPDFDKPFRFGVLLNTGERTHLRNPEIRLRNGHVHEPFFPFNCFDFVSGSRS
jgi:hypothetical protein